MKKLHKRLVLCDLDIVNPYFRTADFEELFADKGIKLAKSDFANSSLDMPAVKLNVTGELDNYDRLIIDVGGDGEGAKALGRFAPTIEEYGYDMLYVINKCRYLSDSTAVDEAIAVMKSIEESSGLSCTAIVNNTNLGRETTDEIIADSAVFARKIADITGLEIYCPPFPVKVYVKPVWEV
jgi:hypothetical protein